MQRLAKIDGIFKLMLVENDLDSSLVPFWRLLATETATEEHLGHIDWGLSIHVNLGLSLSNQY